MVSVRRPAMCGACSVASRAGRPAAEGCRATPKTVAPRSRRSKMWRWAGLASSVHFLDAAWPERAKVAKGGIV